MRGQRSFAHQANDKPFPLPYIPRMTKARTRISRFPQHVREDAFAHYCAGHTRAEVVYRLRLQYGSRAPSLATVKRWMEQGRWTARRRRIEELVARHSDELRGRQIAETVTGNQIVEGAIESARSAVSGNRQIMEILRRVIRGDSYLAGAVTQPTITEEEREASQETAK